VAVALHRACAEGGVEHDALHAVAVVAVAGGLEEVAGELHVGVGAAGGLEGVVSFGEAGEEAVGAGLFEGLLGGPATGGVALGLEHAEAVDGGLKVAVAAADEVRLHGGAEGVDVAVGVEAAEDVFAAGEGVEEGVEQVLIGHGAVGAASAHGGDEIEVFGEDVVFVPEERLVAAGAPGDVALHGVAGEAGESGPADFVEGGKGLRIVEEGVCVHEAADQLVEGVGGEAVRVEEGGGDGLGELRVEVADAVCDDGVVVRGREASEGGGPLAEAVAGGEAGVAVLVVVGGEVAVPSADVDAGRGLARLAGASCESGHLAERLEERVVGEAHEDGLGVALLGEVRDAENGDLVIVGAAEGVGLLRSAYLRLESGCCRSAEAQTEEAAAIDARHREDRSVPDSLRARDCAATLLESRSCGARHP